MKITETISEKKFDDKNVNIFRFENTINLFAIIAIIFAIINN